MPIPGYLMKPKTARAVTKFYVYEVDKQVMTLGGFEEGSILVPRPCF